MKIDKFLLLGLFLLPAMVNAQVSKVKKVMDSCINQRNFNGAVLIAKNGKIEYLKYTGLANRHYDIKYSEATRYQIWSLTKTFTAVLIMQLYEQGKINLDSTIHAYFPAYKGEGGKKITIRNLLTYSSGTFHKDISSPEMIHEAYDKTIWGLDGFIERYLSEKLIDTPGTKFFYNNGDFILLGKIIENIYRKPFEQVLREQILTPLKMTETDFYHHEDIIKNMDEGYSPRENNVKEVYMPTNVYIDNFYSAGAMYSTPKDLLKFDQAIFKHQILKKETVELMTTSYPKLGDVAFGFWVYPMKFGKVETLLAERQGGGYGHTANWVHLIDKDLTFILISNTTEIDELNKMRMKVIGAYLGQ